MKYLQQLKQVSSYLDFGSFRKAASCNLLCWHICMCVYVWVCIWFWALQVEDSRIKKLVDQSDSRVPLKTLSVCVLTCDCHISVIFSSSVSERRQIDGYPWNISFCHLLCLVPTQRVHSGQQWLPSWILQVFCTSMFGTWPLEGILSLPPCPVLIFSCSL